MSMSVYPVYRPIPAPRFTGAVIIRLNTYNYDNPKAPGVAAAIEAGQPWHVQGDMMGYFMGVAHKTVEESQRLATLAKEAGVQAYLMKHKIHEGDLFDLLNKLGRVERLYAFSAANGQDNPEALELARELQGGLIRREDEWQMIEADWAKGDTRQKQH